MSSVTCTPDAMADAPKPHVVTEELRVRGNEILAEAETLKHLGGKLAHAVAIMGEVADELLRRSADKRWKAGEVLLGKKNSHVY